MRVSIGGWALGFVVATASGASAQDAPLLWAPSEFLIMRSSHEQLSFCVGLADPETRESLRRITRKFALQNAETRTVEEDIVRRCQEREAPPVVAFDHAFLFGPRLPGSRRRYLKVSRVCQHEDGHHHVEALRGRWIQLQKEEPEGDAAGEGEEGEEDEEGAEPDAPDEAQLHTSIAEDRHLADALLQVVCDPFVQRDLRMALERGGRVKSIRIRWLEELGELEEPEDPEPERLAEMQSEVLEPEARGPDDEPTYSYSYRTVRYDVAREAVTQIGPRRE